jgi:hypothetical protein
MANKKRLNEIAAEFGNKKDISISLGQTRIYPGKDISNETLERLETALRSPESEQGSLRVSEGKTLIYRSAKGEVTFDSKGVAPAFQSVVEQVKTVDAAEQEYEALMQSVPETLDPQERDEKLAEVALAQQVTPEKYVNLLAHSPYTKEMMTQGTPIADITRDYLAPKMRDYLIAQQKEGVEPISREPGGAIVLAQSKQLIPIPINAPQPELDQAMGEAVSPVMPPDALGHTEPLGFRLPVEPAAAPERLPDPVQQPYERLNPPEASNHASLAVVTRALEAANARIDALQAQLAETTEALQDLSQYVKDSNLGTWATAKAQEIGETSQVIAVQAKSRVAQWMSSKVSGVKSYAHEKLSEGKLAVQGKVDEIQIAAQLKAIEVKEALREKVNELLAPVNVQKLELAARHMIEHYGNGTSYDKAATHSFHLNDNNELSISRQGDRQVVYENGQLTQAADSRDVWKLNTLPDFVAQVTAEISQPEQRREAEMGA